MFGFVKQIFVSAIMFFGFNLSNLNPLKCVLMNNKECKTRPVIIDINSNEPTYHLYSIKVNSIKVNKCSGICNKINDPYTKMCVSNVVKNINIKVLNLMPRTNETRNIK